MSDGVREWRFCVDDTLWSIVATDLPALLPMLLLRAVRLHSP